MRPPTRMQAILSLSRDNGLQRGRTLIELLVAIGLGLLILLGVGTLFLGSNQTSRVAVNVASIEETGQIILSTIGNAVRRAGYSEIVGTSFQPTRADLLYSGPHIRACVGADFVNAAAGNFACNAGVAGIPDTLLVVFQADTAIAPSQAVTLDCLGQVPPNVAVTNLNFAARVVRLPVGQIPLVANVYFVDANGDLSCRGSGNAAAQALVGGVEDFKVYFGFDDIAFANASVPTERPAARSIRNANFINALADPGPNVSRWDFVVSVHVCVTLRTTDAGVTAQASQQYVPCPQTPAEAAGAVTPIAAPADGAIRRSYTEVFSVRSRATPTPAT